MPPSRTYTHQQKRDKKARKRYLCGHDAGEKANDAHLDNHSRFTNYSSRLVLSKYYSRPSRISDDENSSNSESSADISTIHVGHANQYENLSQITENTAIQIDLHRLHLREQSISNEFEEEERGQSEDGVEFDQEQQSDNFNQQLANDNGNDQQQQEQGTQIHQNLPLNQEFANLDSALRQNG